MNTLPFQLSAFSFQRFGMTSGFSVSVFQRFRMTSAFSFSAFQLFSVSLSGFLLFNAVAAQPKFADPSALLQPATNVVPATPRIASNAPPNAASPVSQTTSNLSLTASTNSMDALDDQHKLAIGDRLSFRIVEDEDDPKPLLVTDSGDLEFPYLGRFPAVGRTCKQLARQLKAELEKEYYYQATVIIAVDIMTKSRGKVYLVGPVRTPGPQEIPSDEVLTLSKAILRAGGFGDYADKHKVRVTRKGGAAGGQDQVLTVDVARILEKGMTESDLPLEPGDLIYVPERLIRF
jgi:protein involved in polysaccharide export with SLBB domain